MVIFLTKPKFCAFKPGSPHKKCFQIELTRGYGYDSFHEDLRKLYKMALDDDTVFLFTDTQIVVEEFLEDINNILNSGEVPNLFEKDELEQIMGKARPLAKAAGENFINSYFINSQNFEFSNILDSRFKVS